MTPPGPGAQKQKRVVSNIERGADPTPLMNWHVRLSLASLSLVPGQPVKCIRSRGIVKQAVADARTFRPDLRRTLRDRD